MKEFTKNAIGSLEKKGFSKLDAMFMLACLAGIEELNPCCIEEVQMEEIEDYLHSNNDWEEQLDD